MVAFSNALRGPDGSPLVRAAHVATNSPPPRDVPDLVTATPAGLITATQNYGPFFGWEWTRAGIAARCGLISPFRLCEALLATAARSVACCGSRTRASWHGAAQCVGSCV